MNAAIRTAFKFGFVGGLAQPQGSLREGAVAERLRESAPVKGEVSLSGNSFFPYARGLPHRCAEPPPGGGLKGGASPKNCNLKYRLNRYIVFY